MVLTVGAKATPFEIPLVQVYESAPDPLRVMLLPAQTWVAVVTLVTVGDAATLAVTTKLNVGLMQSFDPMDTVPTCTDGVVTLSVMLNVVPDAGARVVCNA